jgi:hypothetical protein
MAEQRRGILAERRRAQVRAAEVEPDLDRHGVES